MSLESDMTDDSASHAIALLVIIMIAGMAIPLINAIIDVAIGFDGSPGPGWWLP